jgi:Collagen triple helix repeat (20 copies)
MTEVAENAVAVDLQTQVVELRKRVEILLDDHQDFRKVHISRKGPEGGRGLTGEIGPQGVPGKDADVREVVEAAKQAFREEFSKASVRQLVEETRREIAEEYGSSAAVVRQIVLHELKVGGVLDKNGQAILLPGPQGVAGPKGEQGERGPQGDAGKNGVDGVAGRAGSDGVKGDRGLQGEPGISNAPGPQGERGERGSEGLPGIPGQSGLDKNLIIDVVLDLKKRGVI